MTLNISRVVEAVRSVVKFPCGHHDALVTKDDTAAVMRTIADLSNHKPLNELERQLEATCQVSDAVVTSSGTAALHAALVAVGVQPGDAVLVPSMTFAATANAVTYCGATPIFLDSTLADFGVNAVKLRFFLERETQRGPDEWQNMLKLSDVDRAGGKTDTQRIAAIVVVHVAGRPCDVQKIAEMAAARNIPLVEDAAQALGSVTAGGRRPCGSWGWAATLSFNYNKIVTGGAGGAVLTNDPALAAKIRHMVTTARIPHRWLVAHDAVGWNYRMPTLCAALASSQMARLPRMLDAKRALAAAYEAAFASVDGIAMLPEDQAHGTSNKWLNIAMVEQGYHIGVRDQVIAALHERGIAARALFTPMHLLAPYRGGRADNPLVACSIFDRAICLPSGLAIAERYL